MTLMSFTPLRGNLPPATALQEKAAHNAALGAIDLFLSEHLDRRTAAILDGSIDIRSTEFQLAADLIQPGQKVADIGSGSGAWALWAASHGARVEAWEPSPLLCPVAQANFERNRDLSVEFHARWAVVPPHMQAGANLVLPANGVDEACFECYSRPGDADTVPLLWLESADGMTRRFQPDLVFIETAGMACEIAMAIAAAGQHRPRTLIARLRPEWEGEASVRRAVAVVTGLGYSIRRVDMLWDGWVFQR
jgi:hypothetical protein